MIDNEVWEHNEPIDDDEIVIDKRDFVNDEYCDDEEETEKKTILDENGNDIFKKKSSEKTVEERIKTSRSLKIKHNKWNQVDYQDDYNDEKIVIDPQSCMVSSSFEDVEFEKKFHEIIKNSKYKPILLGDEKITINYQIINDMVIYVYARMKKDYSLTQIFVLICEYCGVGLPAMWKRLSSYLQMQILIELRDFSKLPNELLANDVNLFNTKVE